MIIKPIIVSAPMVRAILREIEHPGTGKTMTRRLTGKNGKASTWLILHDLVEGGEKAALWVRETWGTIQAYDDWKPRQLHPGGASIGYATDDIGRWCQTGCNGAAGRWRSPIHMPKWANRLTLEVTGTKIERLQSISEEDAIAEGTRVISVANIPRPAAWSERQDFSHIWDSLHGDGAWDANPEVVAISFKPHLTNIDEWSAQ